MYLEQITLINSKQTSREVDSKFGKSEKQHMIDFSGLFWGQYAISDWIVSPVCAIT